MGIPTEAAPLPAPPANEGNVTFSSGSHQTFKGEIADNIYPGTLKEWKRVQSTFQGKVKDQFCFLFTVDGREKDGELVYYTGCNVSTDPRTKLPPFLKTLGARVPTPESPTLPDLVGKRAKLLVTNEPSSKDPSKTYPKITKVLAA
ncbi:MAG: hypothetical protein ACRDZ4_20950 [Egibacteraceae bacterium]